MKKLVKNVANLANVELYYHERKDCPKDITESSRSNHCYISTSKCPSWESVIYNYGNWSQQDGVGYYHVKDSATGKIYCFDLSNEEGLSFTYADKGRYATTKNTGVYYAK